VERTLRSRDRDDWRRFLLDVLALLCLLDEVVDEHVSLGVRELAQALTLREPEGSARTSEVCVTGVLEQLLELPDLLG
jgi:hypothetical protein